MLMQRGIREADMSVTADDGTRLAGTLVMPSGPGPHPAVVLLWPARMDREGDLGKARFAIGRTLAEALAAHGVASYRFDRRGVAGTPGQWRAATFLQNRSDSAAALRALAARPEIAATGAVGHGEGALHAAWLGAHSSAAAVVMLAGHAMTGEQALHWWAERAVADLPALSRAALRLLGRTPGEQVARLCARIRATEADVARVYGRRVNAGWLRQYLDYDPKPDLAAVGVPLLALTGERDLQVSPDDLEVIAALVPGGETRRLPGLTHTLRREPDPQALRAYGEQYQRPVDALLVEQVASWSAAHLTRAPVSAHAR